MPNSFLVRAPLLALLLLAACDGPSTGVEAAPEVRTQVSTQGAEVGTPFEFDATLGGTAFRGSGLTYTLTFAPGGGGLQGSDGRISGTPAEPGVVIVTLTATGTTGAQATQTFPLVIFSRGLAAPQLPGAPFRYSDQGVPLPAHYLASALGGTVVATDNTPAGNPITDAGAALGRVLFFDRRLSANDAVSCASCHVQAAGFSDTARVSRGFRGETTGRHSMGLTNARFYRTGRFFWDERAGSLEAQVLQPIQDGKEMGMTLQNLVWKLQVTPYYPALFQAAFGSAGIDSTRVARALAQYVRSLTSTDSRFDRAFAGTGDSNDFASFTPEERQGHQLFLSSGCAGCHATNAHVTDAPQNIGLDAVTSDLGAGGGRFKSPSLRNVAVRGRFMHDGRFTSLHQVVSFYDTGVQPNPDLDPGLRGPDGKPRRLNLTPAQRNALVAYLETLTDHTQLTAQRFSDPFPR
ncbi:cytochrome-c peroxidase [Longimicrobium sp.]|jgi:cytochrome c peroxidase|uniref:cytochrome-c peroxidase n=1 Tax=Longimicrobium sp. TaxID=2029185 RepID=UPI002F928B49